MRLTTSKILEKRGKYVRFLEVGDQETERKKNFHALLSDLKVCSRTRNLQKGKKVHAEAIECGHDSSVYVANALITMYAKCGSMLDAHRVFDSLKRPSVVSWNCLILGYVDNGEVMTAFEFFSQMKNENQTPTSVSFLAVLKACTALSVKKGWAENRDRGKALHHLALETGCFSDLYVQNSLIDMYSKCGLMADARQVFDIINYRDVVSWTALILGYAENGEGLNALELFTRMSIEGPAPDSVTFIGALKACTSLAVNQEARRCAECRDWGKAIYQLATRHECISDAYLQNTFVDMYAKCRSMVDAREVFDSVKKPTVITWNALILGYAENGQGHTALEIFIRMRTEGPAPDCVTYAVVLKACTLLGALEFGRTVHIEMGNKNIELDVALVNSLVDFYAKCGSLTEAQSVFYLHTETRDIITWNALLAGFSSRGDIEGVFGLFKKMQDADFQPDGVTFLCILTCCSHVGLVEDGKECFDSMCTKYGFVPSVEHYNCMIDIFGRANKLDDAMALLGRMPCSPNEVTWMTILSACRRWRNVEIGTVAFQSFIKLNDRDAASYVLMGHIYESRGMLQEREMVMGMRNDFKNSKSSEESGWTNGS